jgi:signal transduction histidine kinase/CheY-like chemotaxis protein
MCESGRSASAPTTKPHPDPRILREQVRALHRALPPIMAVHLLVGGAMVATLHRLFPGPALTIWAIAMLAMLLLRGLLYLHYRWHATPQTTARHCRYFLFGAGLSGVLWGLAGVMFFSHSLDYQLFVLFILVGMGAGAISSLTAYMPAFLAYFPISMLPVAIRLLWSDEPVHIGLGLMTLAYISALTFFAHSISRSLAESWRLRFENLDLVEELSAQKNEAEQANVAKSRFLAAASHDLRQPLHALTLYVSLLDEATDAPRVRDFVGKIRRSVDTLQSLFNALLDISKLEAGTLVPERESFAVQPLLDRLANDFAVDAESKRLQLAIPACDAVVYSDPALLEQILRNYLSNAIRYTEQGEIRLAAAPQRESLRFDVSDTGIGIDATQQRLIFDEFYQVDTPGRDRSQGLGLGLAIVARVARLLGHDVAVDSQPRHGATFSVSVPLGRRTEIRTAGAAESTKPYLAAHPVRIVVIDDDIDVRESTRAALEHWGCEVLAVATLNHALSELGGNAPDGVIADYRLEGGHTGLDAIRTLRVHHGLCPGIIVTGDVAAAPLRELKESGLQLLHKPVPPAKLHAFVMNVRRAASARLSCEPT